MFLMSIKINLGIYVYIADTAGLGKRKELVRLGFILSTLKTANLIIIIGHFIFKFAS